MKIRKLFAFLTAAVLFSAVVLTGCGSGSGSSSDSSAADEAKKTVTIAMQNGMSYAPLTIMKEKSV